MLVSQVIFDVGERVYPDKARAMVAGMLDGVQPGLVASLMNYNPGTSTSRTEFPIVQFSGASSGFSLLGFGSTGAVILEDVAPLIHKALSRETPGRVIHAERRTHTLSAERRPYAMRYTIPRMVVQKKVRHANRLKSLDEGKAHLESLFLRSLQRQAAAVGFELPNDLKVAFMGATGDFAAKQDPKSPVAHRGLRNAIFDINLRLGGMWSVGYMLSKGYGHFNATHQLSESSSALSK
jgi:hypothetical protein